MKKLFPAFLAFMLAFSCSRPVQPLRSGDLIFVGIPAARGTTDGMDSAIGAATCRDSLNIIHVAIADVVRDSIWVIDATIKHGVDRHPLDTFLRDFALDDGSLPIFITMRLKDGRDAGRHVERARALTGLAYNIGFTPCETARYCSELVRDSYLRPDGSHIFGEAPMNFLAPDGSMPGYWEELFARLGRPVPQGVPGTNPKAMMGEAALKEVTTRISTK